MAMAHRRSRFVHRKVRSSCQNYHSRFVGGRPLQVVTSRSYLDRGASEASGRMQKGHIRTLRERPEIGIGYEAHESSVSNHNF